MPVEHGISAVPDLNLEARRCDDGVLVHVENSNTTHWLSLEAWALYESISRKDIPGAVSMELLHALRSAGLVR